MSTLYEEGRKFFDLEEYEKALEIYSKGDDEGDVYCSFGLAQLLINGWGIEKNEERANKIFAHVVPILKDMAESGDALAQERIAVAYNIGAGISRDVEQAFYWCEKAAKQGFVQAQINLAICYKEGIGVEQDFEKAVQWFAYLAENGNLIAQFNLAVCCEAGAGIKENHTEAVYWYTKAAEQGHKDAQLFLGISYCEGDGIEKNPEKAVYWFAKAAEQGSVTAQFNLALLYKKGEGVEQSDKQAAYWYTKAAEQGNIKAQFNLAICYENGKGVELSHEKAVYWYTKAATQGDGHAQFNLAICYEHGDGGEQSYEQAVYWYRQAADKGYLSAQYNLALCYYHGNGVKQSFKDAVYWYKQAAEHGHLNAQNNLGACYEYAEGVCKDFEKAAYWYGKAAEAGIASAQYNLAYCYYSGNGVRENKEEAFCWWKKSAEQGFAKAQFNLALGYDLGDGIEQNWKSAAFWYTKAANQGHAKAQNNLGALYYKGTGVEQDYEKAIEYFNQAISGDKPCEEAFYYLGDYYHNGYGGKQDLKRAKEYYLQAAEKGYNCRYALEMVEKDLLLETFYREELKKLPYDTFRRERKARENARSRYEEHLSQQGIRALMKEIAKKGYANPERKVAIEEDLKREFGDTWTVLKENAKKSLVTAFFIYSVFLDMGKEYYEELDFSPVINQLSKAYETELREFFYKGYLRFLKAKGVDCREFVKKDEDQQIAIIRTIKDRKTKEKTYSYQDEEDGVFSLGSFYYLVGTQDLPELAVSDDLKTRKIMSDNYSSKTVNKYILEYACELFSKDAFSDANREKEIVNYLIDISTDAKTIKDYRNPGAHDKTMGIDEAAVTADYLVKIHKVLKQFIDKINPKYLNIDEEDGL